MDYSTLPVPFKLKVVRALTAALQEITPANGYAHDLSAAVFRGRLWYGEEDPLPMVSILEAQLPLEQEMSGQGEGGGLSKGGWPLLIQGFVSDDKLHPSDPAHYLMADVKKRLAALVKPNRGFEILGFSSVTKITLGSGVVRPPDYDVSAKAYFWLAVTLWLAEDHADPYSD